MPEPAVPPGLEAIEHRTFAFYPPVLNIEHNEWRFRKATWSELLVVNTKSDLEIWIPRRYLGQVSQVDEPLIIVGLLKELEYKAGTVWLHEQRVLEMPHTYPAAGLVPNAEPVAPGRRTTGASTPDSRIGRLIGLVLGAGLLLCLLIAGVLQLNRFRPVKFTAADQDFLALSRRDDYFAVVQKLGKPSEDRWRAQSGELQYRSLWYPKRSYYIILLGTDRNDAHYIGALDRNWRTIHYIELPNGADTASMLRSLPRF